MPVHGVYRSLRAISFSGGADRRKLIASFTQTNFVTTSFKATSIVTTGLRPAPQPFLLSYSVFVFRFSIAHATIPYCIVSYSGRE